MNSQNFEEQGRKILVQLNKTTFPKLNNKYFWLIATAKRTIVHTLQNTKDTIQWKEISHDKKYQQKYDHYTNYWRDKALTIINHVYKYAYNQDLIPTLKTTIKVEIHSNAILNSMWDFYEAVNFLEKNSEIEKAKLIKNLVEEVYKDFQKWRTTISVSENNITFKNWYWEETISKEGFHKSLPWSNSSSD